MLPYSVMSMARALVLPARSLRSAVKTFQAVNCQPVLAKFPIHQSVYNKPCFQVAKIWWIILDATSQPDGFIPPTLFLSFTSI